MFIIVPGDVASKSTCSNREENTNNSRGDSIPPAEVEQDKDHVVDLDLSDMSEASAEVDDPDLEQAYVKVDSTG